MKRCPTCKELKESDLFYKNKRQATGLSVECKICTKARLVEYRKRKSAEINAYQAAYRANNRDRVNASNRRWQNNNLEYFSLYRRQFPERKAAWNAKRKSQLKLSVQSSAKSVAYRRLLSTKPCYYCGELRDEMHYDHYYPLARGGTDHWWNLVRACESCNSAKKDKLATLFIVQRLTQNNAEC